MTIEGETRPPPRPPCDRLRFQKTLQSERTVFPADAELLEATERHVGIREIAVDIDCTVNAIPDYSREHEVPSNVGASRLCLKP